MKTILTIAAYLITISLTQAQTLNFSGNWKRNDAKTRVDEGLSINSVPTSLRLDQNAKSLTVTKTNKDGNGVITTYTTTLKFDGSETGVITPTKLHRSSSLKWSADQLSLLEKAISKDDQGNIKQTYDYVYKLEDGGKTVKITAELNANEQTYQLTEVFDKQ